MTHEAALDILRDRMQENGREINRTVGLRIETQEELKGEMYDGRREVLVQTVNNLWNKELELYDLNLELAGSVNALEDAQDRELSR